MDDADELLAPNDADDRIVNAESPPPPVAVGDEELLVETAAERDETVPDEDRLLPDEETNDAGGDSDPAASAGADPGAPGRS